MIGFGIDQIQAEYVAEIKLRHLNREYILKRTKDIIKELGANKRANQFICGFSMETENMLENSVKKLESKNLDMIVANNLKESGAGFGTDTNIVTLITREDCINLPIMTKDDVAKAIIDNILKRM